MPPADPRTTPSPTAGIAAALSATGMDAAAVATTWLAAFAKASPGRMKKVVVLFIGKTADDARVKAVIEPTGAIYRFVEAK